MEAMETGTESPALLADGIKEQIATLEAEINTLRDRLSEKSSQIRRLYSDINDEIHSNEFDENSTLTYGALSEHLENAFGDKLLFLKEYEAFIEVKVNVVAKLWATDYATARETAESIELNVGEDDIDWNGDGQDEITEVYVDDTRIRSVEEQ